jgi:hypothetical protein
MLWLLYLGPIAAFVGACYLLLAAVIWIDDLIRERRRRRNLLAQRLQRGDELARLIDRRGW